MDQPRVGDSRVVEVDLHYLTVIIPLDLGSHFFQLSNRTRTRGGPSPREPGETTLQTNVTYQNSRIDCSLSK